MPPPIRSADTRGGMSTASRCSSVTSIDALPVQYGGAAGTAASDPAAQTTRKLTVGKASPDVWNPRASMAFDNAKGLMNPAGENNCFLNSAVQVLWHLDAFRRNFRLLSGHACMGKSCIFCALRIMFTQFQFSDRAVLPADNLRDALALSFADQQRYQLGLMGDAAECFENILLRMHTHVAHGVSEDSCQEPHCVTHQKFSLTIVEQAVCDCGATAEPFPYTQIVHYVSTRAMIAQARMGCSSFGRLLSSTDEVGETRKCPKNCGRMTTMRQTLTNTPGIVSIGFVWDSDHPSYEHISDVVSCIETILHPADMFYSVVDADWAISTKFHLVGVVCYYGRHYSTFFFHSKMKIWILFDDSRVKKMGPDWANVVDRCIRGRYQPLLLLYANPDSELIDASSAPNVVTRLPEEIPLKIQRHLHPMFRSPDSNQLESYYTPVISGSSGPIAPPTHQLHSSDQQVPRKSCSRQTSYLKAVYRSEEPIQYEKEIDRWELRPPANRGSTQSLNTDFCTKSFDGVAPPLNCDRAGTLDRPRKHHHASSRTVTDRLMLARNNECVSVAPNASSVRLRDCKTAASMRNADDWCTDDAEDSEYITRPYIKNCDVEKVLRKQNVGLSGSRVRQRSLDTGMTQELLSAKVDPVRRTSELLDSVSIGSYKDSGYRSGDEQQGTDSLNSSPTLSASNSAVSLASSNLNTEVLGHGPGTRSLCASSESMSSVKSAQSLPARFLDQRQLKSIPEHPVSSDAAYSRAPTAADGYGYHVHVPAARPADKVGTALRAEQQPLRTKVQVIRNYDKVTETTAKPSLSSENFSNDMKIAADRYRSTEMRYVPGRYAYPTAKASSNMNSVPTTAVNSAYRTLPTNGISDRERALPHKYPAPSYVSTNRSSVHMPAYSAPQLRATSSKASSTQDVGPSSLQHCRHTAL